MTTQQQFMLPKMVRLLLGVEGEVGKIRGKVGYYLNDDGDIVVRLQEGPEK